MIFDNLEVLVEINCRTTPISEHDEVGTKLYRTPSATRQMTSWGAETLKVPAQGEGTPGLSRPLYDPPIHARLGRGAC